MKRNMSQDARRKEGNERRLITYAHRDAPKGQRFRQYSDQRLPKWAVDVQDDVEPDKPRVKCSYESCKNEAAFLVPQIDESRRNGFVWLPVCAEDRDSWFEGGDFTEEDSPVPVVPFHAPKSKAVRKVADELGLPVVDIKGERP